jgi:hypothetical protein
VGRACLGRLAGSVRACLGRGWGVRASGLDGWLGGCRISFYT